VWTVGSEPVFKGKRILLLEAAAERNQHQLPDSFSSRVCALSAGTIRLLQSMFVSIVIPGWSPHHVGYLTTNLQVIIFGRLILTLLVGRQEEHLVCKNVGCWWCQFDWSFACLIALIVTTTSFIFLSSNKIQNGDIPVVVAYPSCPQKWHSFIHTFILGWLNKVAYLLTRTKCPWRILEDKDVH